MDTILIAVTAIALALTATMVVILVTVLRQERARSEARVAALSAMAADAIEERPEPMPREVLHHGPTRRVVAAPRPEPTVTPIPQFSETPVVDDVDDLEIREGVSGVSHLFADPEPPSPWGRRFVVIGCLAALVLAIGMTLVFSRARSSSTDGSANAAQAAPAAAGVPLELLSLKYSQETDRLVISGMVQNPRGAAPLSHVVAAAFVFGPDGTFLSSGRAPLDFITLTPGEGSPFVVNVPVTGQVTRYRVGFRTEDGRVLPHIDKRTPEALAQK
jgi:hypothetical protein